MSEEMKIYSVDLEIWNDEEKEDFYIKSLTYNNLKQAELKYLDLMKYPLNRHVDSHLFKHLSLVVQEDEDCWDTLKEVDSS